MLFENNCVIGQKSGIAYCTKMERLAAFQPYWFVQTTVAVVQTWIDFLVKFEMSELFLVFATLKKLFSQSVQHAFQWYQTSWFTLNKKAYFPKSSPSKFVTTEGTPPGHLLNQTVLTVSILTSTVTFVLYRTQANSSYKHMNGDIFMDKENETSTTAANLSLWSTVTYHNSALTLLRKKKANIS